MRPLNTLTIIFTIALSMCMLGCERKPAATANNAPPAKPQAHTHADGSTHSHDHSHAGHHGNPIDLGSMTAGQYTVRAARDEGAVTAGGDAPIDVWVTGGSAKVTAVRFWIGTQDAKGSIKAKAEIEFPSEPDHWHTHAEVPAPMPADSKLWVEIEDDQGGKTLASFDLKL